MANYDRAKARLLILQALEKKPQYQADQETILKFLRERGFVLSRDYLHIELSWLEVTADAIVDRTSGGVHIAMLTPEGLEIVLGIVDVPGISRPAPIMPS